MAVNPFSSAGTILQVNINSVFTAVGKVDGFTIATAGKPSIDSTGLENLAKTKVGGLPDNGQASGTVHMDPRDTTHKYLFTRSQTANTTENWKVILPFSGADNTISFDGAVQNMQLNLAKDQTFQSPFTIEVSGAITFS